MRSRIEIGGARPYKILWGSFLVPRDRVKRTLNKLSGKASNCCYIMYLRPNQKSHQEKCPSGVGRSYICTIIRTCSSCAYSIIPNYVSCCKGSLYLYCCTYDTWTSTRIPRPLLCICTQCHHLGSTENL